MKLEVNGREAFPKKSTPFILASNHLSHFDPPLLGVAAPYKLSYLAKDQLFENRVFGFFLRNIGVISLNRESSDIGALRAALRVLETSPLVVFPQGTRGQSLDQFNHGVGFLCKRANVPVIVAKIEGTDKALPKGAKMPRRAKVKVSFARLDKISNANTYQEITNQVMQAIKTL